MKTMKSKLVTIILAMLCSTSFALLQAGTVSGVKSVRFTNTQPDWFYIEEIEIPNDSGEDVASSAFGATASANFAPGFGSNVNGAIDDVFANCCGTGTHSDNDTTAHTYTITLPSEQTLVGDVTMWNRQDGCCPERLDGFLVEFFSGDDASGLLLSSVQVDNLAADSGGAISTATGASFPIPFPDDDMDGDGLPDAWETANGTDPDDNGEDPNNNGVPGDPDNGIDGDPDGDGLTNGEEFTLGTHANMADTDEDGLDDNVETNDGVFVDETATGTDPRNDDTDNDGLLDGVETNTGTYDSESATGTDPLDADSDDDTLPDGVENHSLPYDADNPETQPGTDPNKADTDGDDYEDAFEITAGSDPTDADSVPPPPPSGALNGVRSVKISNTREDWFYIEEIEILNSLNQDVASVAFGSTASHDSGPTFGSSSTGAIDDVFGNCCGTGWHSGAFAGTPQFYTVTFPSAQSLQGDITIWNRQDGCCPNRLDGLLIEYFAGADGTGDLLASQEVENLAADSDGAISSPTGASFAIVGPLVPPRVDLSISLDVDELIFTWESSGGKLYNLRSETDPSGTLPLDWPIFGGNADLEATPPTNTLAIALPPESFRLFVIEEFNAPPVSVFSDDFESGQGAWVAGGDTGSAPGTMWELGAPGAPGPAAANSGAAAWGTNLTAAYNEDANVFLQSPAIDLTTAGGATLNFSHFVDIEEMFDAGTVTLLDAADDSEIITLDPLIEGVTGTWEPITFPIPPEALGKSIKIQFRFEADDFGPVPQAGWYIDDVNVTVP